MNSVYFGIIIGLFLYFAGSRFIVVAMGAWKSRKEDNEKRLIEMIKNEMKKK